MAEEAEDNEGGECAWCGKPNADNIDRAGESVCDECWEPNMGKDWRMFLEPGDRVIIKPKKGQPRNVVIKKIEIRGQAAVIVDEKDDIIECLVEEIT